MVFYRLRPKDFDEFDIAGSDGDLFIFNEQNMRGKQSKAKKVTADPVYNSQLLAKFINYMMQDGKKHIAHGIVYTALELLEKETKMKAMDAFNRALLNVKPKVEVRSRRVGGANYQVPIPVSESRQQALAFRWIVNAVRSSRGGKTTAERLAQELILAFKKEGDAVKKREDTHKMADANKAFSHLTW